MPTRALLALALQAVLISAACAKVTIKVFVVEDGKEVAVEATIRIQEPQAASRNDLTVPLKTQNGTVVTDVLPRNGGKVIISVRPTVLHKTYARHADDYDPKENETIRIMLEKATR